MRSYRQIGANFHAIFKFDEICGQTFPGGAHGERPNLGQTS